MKTKATITVKNKVYPYMLEKTATGTVRIVAKGACLDQEFLSEDVGGVILDLPNLNIVEQGYRKDIMKITNVDASSQSFDFLCDVPELLQRRMF